MADQHVYLALQRLSLSDTNWADLKAWFMTKVANQTEQYPAFRYHIRTSLDGTIVIAEAMFNGGNISEEAVRQGLATAFGVALEAITYATGFNVYGRFATYAYNSVNRFRFGLFGAVEGGGWPTWAESRAACAAYILANLALWEPEDV